MKKYKKFIFPVSFITVFVLLDLIDVTLYLDFININYKFWSSLITPLIIFYLGVNTFNQYQKDRNAKKDKLYQNILDIKILAIIELSTSIYMAFQVSPLPKRLADSMNDAPPFYIVEFKQLEQELINALSNCEEYDASAFEKIHECRKLLGASTIQHAFPPNNEYDKLYAKLLQEEEFFKTKLSNIESK